MSISLSGYGIDVDGILAKFGSKRSEHIDSLRDKLDPKQLKVFEQAVMEGVPFKGLHEEEWPHILVIKRLFEGAPNATWGDVEFHYLSLVDMIMEFTPDLDMNTRELMSYFVDGRPIFGHTFGDTEARYGYLTASEVKALNKALDRFKLPEPDSEEWDDLPLEALDAPYSEFTAALTQLLPSIVEKNQGMALYVG